MSSDSRKAKDKTQQQRFIDAAREAGASEDEAVFDENLRQIAPTRTAKPMLMPRLSKDGAYLVIVTWPNGLPQEVGSFKSETEAREWIDNEAEAWIAKHPMSSQVSNQGV